MEMGSAGAGQGMGCPLLEQCKTAWSGKKSSRKGRKIGIAGCSADQCL